MKVYTKKSLWDGMNYKYPITNKDTGNTYEVVIHPYGMDDERYLEGCIVSLRKKKWLSSKEILKRCFENNDGKIDISNLSSDEETEFDYNLINMTKLIVQLYEANNVNELESLKGLKEDFAEFSKWDGIV